MPEINMPALASAYRDEARADPTNPLSWYFRALCCRDQGDMDGWRSAIGTAFTLPHATLHQRYHRGLAQLMLGDWSGWADYEVRALQPEDRPTYLSLDDWIRWLYLLWDGFEDVSDKTVLVLPEQGVGDNIQMLRFLPVLADRAKRVIAMVYPRLVPLLQSSFGDRIDIAIHGVDKPLSFDRYVRIMSLPHAIGGLPPFAPLRAPRRRQRLGARTRLLRGGICWAGNPAYPDDERRSMPAEHMAPLMTRPDIEWHSLQVGSGTGDADRYPSLMRAWPPLITFGDTADLIVELDFVVAVDTAVAHLAGCLGVQTYLLLPTRSDFRWGLGTETPWYPTMQLVRQREEGGWPDVVSAVQRALDELTDDAGAVSPAGMFAEASIL